MVCQTRRGINMFVLFCFGTAHTSGSWWVNASRGSLASSQYQGHIRWVHCPVFFCDSGSFLVKVLRWSGPDGLRATCHGFQIRPPNFLLRWVNCSANQKRCLLFAGANLCVGPKGSGEATGNHPVFCWWAHVFSLAWSVWEKVKVA